MKKTDSELILEYLQDGQWHNIIDMSQYLKPGCYNWAARSRVSDINKRFKKDNVNKRIDSRIGDNKCAEYRLVDMTYKFDSDNQGILIGEGI